MKKKIISMISALFLITLILAACAEELQTEESPNQLTFTTIELTGVLTANWPTDYPPLTLADEQIIAVFPDLGLDIIASATYFDGELVDVNAVLKDCNAHILIGRGRVRPLMEYFSAYQLRPPTSNMYGVDVAAVIVSSYTRLAFQADFNMEDIAYRVSFYETHDRLEVGKERMTGIVSRLILGGPADLSTLLLPPSEHLP